MKRIKPLGAIALILAIIYLTMPYDMDYAWYGYIDDFFVFMAGYCFFMGNRLGNSPTKKLLYTLSVFFFIIGILTLIALILFT